MAMLFHGHPQKCSGKNKKQINLKNFLLADPAELKFLLSSPHANPARGGGDSFWLRLCRAALSAAAKRAHLWRKDSSESIGTGRKYKGRTLYYDFYLRGPFPATVGEVKVINPNIGVKSNFSAFNKDLDKCEGWLIPETPFKYALAILIDLTGTMAYRDAWDDEITSKNWPQKNIFPWLIAPSGAT